MEKIKYENIKDMYNDFAEGFNETIALPIKIGGAIVDVEVYKTVPISDIDAISKLITVATFIDGTYNKVNYDLFLAKYALEYLTNLPLPLYDEGDDGDATDERVNLVLCYEIYNKLYDAYAYDAEGVIDESFIRLASYSNIMVNEAKAELSKTGEFVDQLAKKMLDLYEYTKLVLKDYAENPAAFLNLVEKLGIEDEDELAEILQFPGVFSSDNNKN